MNIRAALACLILSLVVHAASAGDRVEAGNDYYRVVIVDDNGFSISSSRGMYTAYTGPLHPLTARAARPAEIVATKRDCVSCGGIQDATAAVVRSYSSRNDYHLGEGQIDDIFREPDPAFNCQNMNYLVLGVVEQIIEGAEVVGARASWDVEQGSDQFRVELLERVSGEDWIGSAVEFTLSVRNDAMTPLVVGLRHVLAPRLSYPIGPANPGGGAMGKQWVALRPTDPPTAPLVKVETEWAQPSFRALELVPSHDDPIYRELLYSIGIGVGGPATLAPPPTPPDLVQVAAANLRLGEEGPLGGAADRCFEWHVPDPPREIANFRRQMAVVMYWGLDAAHALVAMPGETVSVTQYLVAYENYPLATLTDGPFSAPCEGPVTRVPISGGGTTIEPTVATMHHRWSSPDPLVTFADPTAPVTEALVTGLGTFPVTLTASVGAYEASAGTTVTVLSTFPPRDPRAPRSCGAPVSAPPPTSTRQPVVVGPNSRADGRRDARQPRGRRPAGPGGRGRP